MITGYRELTENEVEKNTEKKIEKEIKPEIKSPKIEIKSSKSDVKVELKAAPKFDSAPRVEVKVEQKVVTKVEPKVEVKQVEKPKKAVSNSKDIIQQHAPEEDDDFVVIAKKKTKKVVSASPAVTKIEKVEVEKQEKIIASTPLKVTPIEVLSTLKPVMSTESVKTDKGATLSRKPNVSEFLSNEKVTELGEIVSPFKGNSTIEKPVVEKGNTFGSKKIGVSSFDQLMEATLNKVF